MMCEFDHFQIEFEAETFRNKLPHEYIKTGKFQLQTHTQSWRTSINLEDTQMEFWKFPYKDWARLL